MQYLRDRIGQRSPAASAPRRHARAVGLGLLVLFTIWGFGRAWHGGFAPVEFVIGVLAGAVSGALAWRRPTRPARTDEASSTARAPLLDQRDE